jgi:outer membrane biosynthesis protein TonB
LSSIRADAPWQRLPWLTPLALALSLAALIGFQRILGSDIETPAPPAPIEVGVIETPAPPTPSAPTSPAPTPAPAQPVTPQQPSPPAELSPRQEQPAAQLAPKPVPPAAIVPPEKPPAVPPQPRTIESKMQEVSRRPSGMTTEPLNRSATLSKEERQRLDETYHVGQNDENNPVEATEGPRRAAASKRLPPLTKQQWAILDKIYHVGAGGENNSIEPQVGPLRAAASKRLPPLTKAQWAALDEIYHVGRGTDGNLVEADEAGRRGAISFMTAFATPNPVTTDPTKPSSMVSHSGMAAQAVQQPMPSIPPDLRLPAGVVVAVARFQVGADGAATVALTGPTSEPKLNDLLLATFRKWRFTPAFQYGSAVASTVEVKLTISVPGDQGAGSPTSR